MIRIVFSGLVLLASTSLFAGGVKDSTAMRYGSTITSADLSRHLHILASDSYEGRETGRKGQKMAAEYISGHFKEIGLPGVAEGGYYQHFSLILNDPTGVVINSGETEFNFIEDFYFFNKPDESPIVVSEIVFVGFGIADELYNDYMGVNVAGKAVVMLEGEPQDKKGNSYVDRERSVTAWSRNRKKKLETAMEQGATMAFTVVKDYDLIVKDLRHYLEKPKMELESAVKGKPQSIPNIYISETTAKKMLGLGDKDLTKMSSKISKKGIPLSFSKETTMKISTTKQAERIESENVLGYIEGTDKAEELLIITAHYDHIGVQGDEIYNGADDDGSGTVALLEIAQAFAQAKKDGKGPRRSVLIMPVSGEEKGLLGSQFYVENPVFNLTTTVADLNIDMIGRMDEKHPGNSNYVYLIGSDKLSTELHAISEEANEKYTGLDLDYTFNDPEDQNRFYYRSDHYNFARNNIPVIFYFNGVHEDYHKPTDTVDKIDFGKMETISRLVFYTAWDLANREKRIEVDVVNDFK